MLAPCAQHEQPQARPGRAQNNYHAAACVALRLRLGAATPAAHPVSLLSGVGSNSQRMVPPGGTRS